MSLATKYRPKTFADVCEQTSIKVILEQQIKSGEFQHAYLFCGGAGTGKTTLARIFANGINKGKGNPIEMDSASHNSVDDIRDIKQQATVQSLDSEYRIFILDEVHALSSNAWQALLKILEEPPKKSVFIMCTTNPEKIPRTILSRVQRFDFKRISFTGVKNRLQYICESENKEKGTTDITYDPKALDYISKIADGGMRDAITLLDKCLAYSHTLTEDNIITALGTVSYEAFFTLSDAIHNKRAGEAVTIIECVHREGKDLKQFIRDYVSFLLDINKYDILRTFDYLQLPTEFATPLSNYCQEWFDTNRRLLPKFVKLNADLKWDTQVKVTVEAKVLEVIYAERV